MTAMADPPQHTPDLSSRAALSSGGRRDWATELGHTPTPPPLSETRLEGHSGLRPVSTRHDREIRAIAERPPFRRYHDLSSIARGGCGEVRRMVDRTLNRVVAVKILREDLARDPGMVRRFMHEAQVIAQLDHPAIVPVHELGQFADDRWYLTMKEIEGKTLRDIIADLHEARGTGRFVATPEGWTLRRCVEALRTVCEAIGFAHSKGVIHRDLKPDNVMVGDFGEVYVVDWGLALVHGAGPESDLTQTARPSWDDVGAARAMTSSTQTEHGLVVGTPAYMPPEQARGERDRIGAHSDVWALGAMLYAILFGRPPFRGGASEVLKRVCQGPPVPPLGIPVPDALDEVWRRCMRADPADRYPTARAVAADIDAWLEGSRARERAMGLVEQARRRVPALAEARLKATRSRERARAAVVSLRPSDPLEVKEAAWALEDQAHSYARELDERYQEISTRARLALAQVPDLPEARAILADQYRERAEAAEATGDATAARELRALLASYDDGRHAAYLRADGELRLTTEPSGAQVRVYRYEQQARRLATTGQAVTGPTPILALRLPVGTYLLELVTPDRPPIRYPVTIGREQPWASVAPGSRSERAVWIPEAGVIRSVERYVPAGWFLSGGDPEAHGALPRRRVWVEACSLASRPVTFADYLAFLNDRVTQGDMDAAQRHMPRLHPRDADIDPLVAFDTATHRFRLRDTVGALRLSKASPVVGVSWHDAQAYCRWLAERTSMPWRLPGEHEREKAARGVDGRSFPWGEHADPAFHCMQDSALSSPGPPSTSLFPVDQSPYAIFGLAGGVQEWCADVYRTEGPRQQGSCAVVPPEPSMGDTRAGAHAPRRSVRGGAWNLPAQAGRGASRSGARATQRAANRGFRVCRSLTGDQGSPDSKR